MITFKIVTPAGITYADENVAQVSIPTTTGEITVLPNHIPLVSILAPGELKVMKDGQEALMAVSSGLVEVRPKSEVRILAGTAERAEHISIERAQAARARAEKLMAEQKGMADVDFAKLQAVIERELARERVARKYRKLPFAQSPLLPEEGVGVVGAKDA